MRSLIRNARLLLFIFVGITFYSFAQPFAFPEEFHFPAEKITLNDADEVGDRLLFRAEETDQANLRQGADGNNEAHHQNRCIPGKAVSTLSDQNHPFYRYDIRRPTFLVNRQLLI